MKDKVNKFYTHLIKVADEAVKRMQEKKKPIYPATLTLHGETLEIPFNADTFDALEAFLMDLRNIEIE